ncbi:HD domain-containing protein [Persicobacter sp. CCB-QB2]|uniref:HD domain-containing protein n=1 Tax=Persicobacter sp. CCB-QB2 TaxID=1561025 RepID=UPI0006A9C887|nr:HD domain-containing protein [Persicobacter sp. CCB-QB2]
MNKKKIINDPVYGFINIKDELIFDLIEHPYIQRLRRIRQLGLTDMVYPGAMHTRFHHAIGAMHLMTRALEQLRDRGVEISDSEILAAKAAILLHDLGHGPFSHALEFTLLKNVNHEDVSLFLMEKINKSWNGSLDLAIKMYKKEYERPFFGQLISSQLDMDRLDYLQRDSFFTGVHEGTIGAQRIIKMLAVDQDQLVVEEKGIYSIENFLNARRLMYWQVYLHKTALAAEQMLIKLIQRAQYLARNGENVPASEALTFFLKQPVDKNFDQLDLAAQYFVELDDYDIIAAMKTWGNHPDRVLSLLSHQLLNREIFKIQLKNQQIPTPLIKAGLKKVCDYFKISEQEASFLMAHGTVSNSAYLNHGDQILILQKDGEIVDLESASDLPNITAMSKIVKKYYLCLSKNVSL